MIILCEDGFLKYILTLLGLEEDRIEIPGERINYSYVINEAIKRANRYGCKVLAFVDTKPEDLRNRIKNLSKEFRRCENKRITCKDGKGAIEVFRCVTNRGGLVVIVNICGEHKRRNSYSYSAEGFIANCIDKLVYCYHGQGARIERIENDLVKHLGKRYLEDLKERIRENKELKEMIEYCKKIK